MPIATAAAIALAISAGATAGGQIASSKIQANSARRAGQIQSTAANEALEWEKQQQAKAQADYDGWLNGADMMRLGDVVRGGQSPGLVSNGGGNPLTMGEGGSTTFGQMRSAGYGQTPAAGALVTMRSPNGQTKQVAAALVPHYTQRGAQVVR